MLKKYVFTISVFFLIFLASISLASESLDLTDIGVGARPLGMGKAFVAVADDGTAIFINPAGLSLSKNLKIVSMAGNLMSEVPYTMAGVCFPFLKGTLGIGYTQLSVSGIEEYSLDGITPEATGNNASFTNSLLSLSYSTSLESLFGFQKNKSKLVKLLKIGGTIKISNQNYIGASSFKAGNGSGVDADLGIIIPFSLNSSFGLVLKNIIPGNNLRSDELSTSVIAGFSSYLFNKKLLVDLDAEFYRNLFLHFGFEWNPVKVFYLRAGVNQKPSANEIINNLAIGLGLNLKGFTFDYAYNTYADISDFSTHYFSFGYNREKDDSPAKKIRAAIITPIVTSEGKSLYNKKLEEFSKATVSSVEAVKAKNVIKIKKYQSVKTKAKKNKPKKTKRSKKSKLI